MKSSVSMSPTAALSFALILSQISFSLAVIASLGVVASAFGVALVLAFVSAGVFDVFALLDDGVVLQAEKLSKTAASKINRFIFEELLAKGCKRHLCFYDNRAHKSRAGGRAVGWIKNLMTYARRLRACRKRARTRPSTLRPSTRASVPQSHARPD